MLAEEDAAAEARVARAARRAASPAPCSRGSTSRRAARPARGSRRRSAGGSGRRCGPRARRRSPGTRAPPSPRAGALPAHELDRRPRIGRHRVARLERLQLGDASRVTFVPIPASVNSSSSSACGRRPSMMWADPTPPRIASTQAPSFGRMPPATSPRAASTSPTLARERSEPASSRIGEPAADVGEEDRLVGAQGRGDLAGGRIGVDVVGVALAVGPDRGDHRDVVARRCG